MKEKSLETSDDKWGNPENIRGPLNGRRLFISYLDDVPSPPRGIMFHMKSMSAAKQILSPFLLHAQVLQNFT